MTKISLVLILTILASNISVGQEYATDSLIAILRADIDEQRKYNSGTFVWDDDTKENYYELLINSTLDDLKPYMNDSDPFVRCLIFNGIVLSNPDQQLVDQYLEKSELNSDLLRFKNGGTIKTWTEHDYMLNTIQNDSITKIDFDRRLSSIRASNALQIKGVRHDRISKDDLGKLSQLQVRYKGYSILSFDLWIRSGSNPEKYSALGAQLNLDMKMALQKLSHQDQFGFENIRISTPDGTTRKLGLEYIMVKE